MSRERFRVGDHLILDEESGLTVWASEVVKQWDGVVVRHEYADVRQPQSMVNPIVIEQIPGLIRAVALTTAFVCASSYGTVVNGTTVSAKANAASHLFDLTFVP